MANCVSVMTKILRKRHDLGTHKQQAVSDWLNPLQKRQRYRHLAMFDSKIRLFGLSTSTPMDIHLVRVPQGVDVEMSGESQQNEENVPHFFGPC